MFSVVKAFDGAGVRGRRLHIAVTSEISCYQTVGGRSQLERWVLDVCQAAGQ